jgi:hypothetical protein
MLIKVSFLPDVILSLSILLFCLVEPTLLEEREVSVEGIAKSAADEAARIFAMEAAASAIEEARKIPEELDKPSGNTSEPVITDAELGEARSDKPSTDIHPSAPEAQALTGPLEPVNQQHESRAPSSFGAGEPTFEDAIMKIYAPFSSSVTVPDSSDDSAADLTFLTMMAADFKDVQDRYGKRWEKLHTQQQAVVLAEQKLKERRKRSAGGTMRSPTATGGRMKDLPLLRRKQRPWTAGWRSMKRSSSPRRKTLPPEKKHLPPSSVARMKKS